MTARTRVILVVALASLGAAAAAVGAVVLSADADDAREPAGRTRPSGAPPLFLDLGVRSDREANALRQAAAIYEDGREVPARRAEAGRLFARYSSPNARVGAAFARWPNGTVGRLRALARARPRSGLVRLNLGLALYWAGRRDDAVAAWRAARRVEPDSLSAVRADDLLHPNFARGLPTFVPSFALPRPIAAVPPQRRLGALARAARSGGVRERLLYGVALQQVGRPLSARRAFAAARAASPNNLEARVADAVGRFEKGRPEAAFSRLGPLTRRYPRSATVRFHLGLLLLWSGSVEAGRRQLRLAASTRGPLSVEARRFLRRLGGVRTS